MAYQQKRFIAGATCPKCKAIDSIMLYMLDKVEQLECVMCGYQESQADLETQSSASADDSVIGLFKPE